jgi:chemotaxis protein CheZ
MGDSAELEALFERVRARGEAAVFGAAEEAQGESPPAETADAAPSPDAVHSGAQSDGLHQRLGQLTRTLHDTLHELGYDRTLEKATRALPQARDRLQHIAQLTGEAAGRVLTAAETAGARLDPLSAHAEELSRQWEKVYAGEAGVEGFRRTADLTRDFFKAMPAEAAAARAQLTEIILAQEFQDLTGQVIQRMLALAGEMERELVGMLVQTSPAARSETAAREAAPVETFNQQQVDALLDSLGF